ncbi:MULTISPECIES: TonB-dependent receptor [Pseudoxanthomonas]|uniref:TonB-dependent receptor n=1 Tax=Pseudoxanthomonas winnipegensis TaxID=2480810 RepID=A0AAW8GDM8_9GAMM|nr:MULTISPECIES: TonB-dependent receptor [Pseudoxanthomonas]MDQ1120539.1 TonB-dependent receptor [Pseudoxanthomonas winnipegensis]MDQ1133758.1 TonB-dependent receptor [Pseudoxanthomonas winnipegensis]MDR6140000.1 TonB-dependent receptor [Pseudoxanthomonas sp. SORGH_AS_0997]
MSTAHRIHPLAIAVTLSLFAALPAAAVTSPTDPASGEQDTRSDATQATTPAAASTPKSSQDQDGKNPDVTNFTAVTVTGVRESQAHAIDVKRDAANIQDSITAENIGALPDTTITDSLQRITGVQINRDAGVGTSVDVRGLPQVGTMLNGEVFITADQIDSQQPDFTMLPSTLFQGVDVVKSATANETASGISGAIDLHTYRPWDLPSGFTYSYSANGERGTSSRRWGPEANGLISYNDDHHWGVLASVDYSDTTRSNSREGLDQYGVVLNGENAASAGGYNGFLTPWNGAPIPSQIVQNADGTVDVNGDGKSNGVFMGSQDINLWQQSTRRKRKSGNLSFQADLGGGFNLTSDFFYSQQHEWNTIAGIQFNSTNWQGATYVPNVSRDTGRAVAGAYGTPDPDWAGSQMYTTQVYQKWPGDVESFSEIAQKDSIARNFNLQLDYDNGGLFTGSLRGLHASATQSSIETDVNISNSDGALWPNHLMDGVPDDAVPPGTMVYPAQLGGNRVFNSNGMPQNTVPVLADFRGRYLKMGLPQGLADQFANPYGWSLKTLESSGDYDRQVALNALRFDGKLHFNDGLVLQFGVRNSIRNAGNRGWTLEAPVYAGMGASDPKGCLVRYVGADVVLDSGACTAGNDQGYFRAGSLSALQMPLTAAPLSRAWKKYDNLLGSGLNFWAINPDSMINPLDYWQSLYPGTVKVGEPGTTWDVGLHELSSYLQLDFGGDLGQMPYSGNVGVRVVRTGLNVTQYLGGAPGAYGDEPVFAGTETTHRSYTDVLPAANFSLDITEGLKLRLAYSKNMMPLDLSTWGGGLQLDYSLMETPDGAIFRVSSGQSSGNPDLKPWRSSNYGASLEYYINASSMLSLALFRINMESFIKNGSVTNCTLPDEDGVVRNHCIVITEPVQGSGNSIQGAEFDYRQGFTFLPGLLANTGVEVNATYAPSDSGERDLAGKKIPFQDNSTKSGNLILWYQDGAFQTRLAYNYRSRRAVGDSIGGITGMELYEAPQKYLDASASYKLSKYAELVINATNLTNEYQKYYLVWPDQPAHSNFSERMFTFGVRGQW